jgi:regulator of protease activity HflC (stomatin/prohibitin superfamily)
VKGELTGVPRNEVGPQLFYPGVYDEIQSIEKKIVLENDQYVVLVDKITGAERVLRGPQTVVPEPLEEAKNGKQRAIFLDNETAALVLDRTTGKQRLVQENVAFIPPAYVDILEVRKLIHVLPHEAVVVRDPVGELIVHSGGANGGHGTAFFLPPYSSLLTQEWSDYSRFSTDGSVQEADKLKVTKIDLRANKMLFQYEVRTSDNVKLVLEGTVFWQVKDIAKMINSTPDPESDVWHHARSSLIQAVSNSTLAEFMSNFNSIIKQAWNRESRATFYEDRGVELQSMELTRFDCADEKTAMILQEIIQETTNRINRLTAQESENEVRAAKMTMDIQLERQRTELIQTQSDNEGLQARMQGEAEGMRLMTGASTFIGGLNESIPNVDSRVDLYKLHEELKSRNLDTKHLSSGSAQLFLTPADMKLRLDMADSARRLGGTTSSGASVAPPSAAAAGGEGDDL